MAIARRALDIRSADRDFSDAHALEQAMLAVAAAVTNFLVHRSPDQSDDNGEADTNDVAVHRAMETLDRAYGRARIATNKDAIPHLSVRPQFMRPDKTSELWCLPQLSWFGTADLTQVEAATSALNEAIASNTLLCGKVTPEQFHQRRRGLDGQTP